MLPVLYGKAGAAKGGASKFVKVWEAMLPATEFVLETVPIAGRQFGTPRDDRMLDAILFAMPELSCLD